MLRYWILGIFIIYLTTADTDVSKRDKICTQPKTVGPCRAAMQRWWYNSETKKCEQFLYGGCDANENNFQAEQECQKTCVANQPQTRGIEIQDPKLDSGACIPTISMAIIIPIAMNLVMSMIQ